MNREAGRAAGIGLAVLAGAGMAGQARINGELGHRLGDGIAAAAISFGIGLLLLLCTLPWLRSGLRAVRGALRGGRLPWWQCLGGMCGALLVATQGMTAAVLGVAVFTVAVVAGQSTSSLLVDRAGHAPGAARPITRSRALGAALCVVAVLIAVSDSLGDPRALGLAALPALAGIGIAWQQGVNGLVREAAGAVLPATLINFLVGTTTLLVAFGIELALKGPPPGALPTEPWLYLGGPLGIVFIATAASVVHRVGVLVLGLSMISGQIVGALAMDLALPGIAGPPDLLTLAGALLALLAVLLAARPS